MEQTPKPHIGRPWSFDRDRAVDVAMELFWRHGYEGVSIGHLTEAIGVAPPSLYAAFGSKAGLYGQALTRYEETVGCLDVAAIGTAASLSDAVRRMLEGAVRNITQRAHTKGCMVSSGMVACHPDHAPLARDAAARREALRERIAEALSGFVAGDPPARHDELQRLSRYLAAVLQGISIQARDGVAASDLLGIVDDVVTGVVARASSHRDDGNE